MSKLHMKDLNHKFSSFCVLILSDNLTVEIYGENIKFPFSVLMKPFKIQTKLKFERYAFFKGISWTKNAAVGLTCFSTNLYHI